MGNLYLIASSGGPSSNPVYWVVEADAHTGQEVKRLQLPAPTTTGSESFFDIVFDPVNELVYVGCPETDAAPGQVLALDARDLTVRWTYLTKQIFRAPRLALNGTQLCFPDDQNILYMFDTRDALAQTKEKGGSPKPRWTWQVADPSGPRPHKAGARQWTSLRGRMGFRPRYQYRIPRRMQRRRWQQPAIQRHRRYGHRYGDGCESHDRAGSRPSSRKGSDRTAGIIYICSPYTNVVWAVNIETDAEPVKDSFFLPAGEIFTGLAYDDGTRLGQGLSPKPDFSKIKNLFRRRQR